MSFIPRNDRSVFGRWWHEVDHTLIQLMLIFIVFGWIIMFTGSVHEAQQSDFLVLKFSARKAAFALTGIGLMFGASFIPPTLLPRLVWVGYTLALGLLASLLVLGLEQDGGTRWLHIPGLPFYPQPTEFAKPFLVLALALCFARARTWGFARAWAAATAVFACVAVLIYIQRDVSQTAFVTLIFLVMAFMAGVSWPWVLTLTGIGATAGMAAYHSVGHFRDRVDNFWARLWGHDGDRYDQLDMVEAAFRNGGLQGLGLGEGDLKTKIPAGVNDMTLAIIGEELGMIGVLAVFALILVLWARTQRRVANMTEDFPRLAATGLAFLLVGQALIHIFYTLGLLPPTGITLPFFSDGGSSLIASALTVGLLLSLTRQRGPRR